MATAGQSSSDNGISDQGKRPGRCIQDYVIVKEIGEGSYSTVFLTKEKATGKEFAMKMCDRNFMVRNHKAVYAHRERDAMVLLSENPKQSVPFFVQLVCAFKDDASLYFVLSYESNGDILCHLRRVGFFDTNCAQFYTAELVHAVEYMHGKGIIHRDLKPENILLNAAMHIRISDFGVSKIIYEPQSSDPRTRRRTSFVGTAQYVSPEVLTSKKHTFACDLWALGCILYQFIAGVPPFRGDHEYMIFQKITKLEYDFPPGFDSVARDLVEKLIVSDSAERLLKFGIRLDEDLHTSTQFPYNVDYSGIKGHPFLSSLDFDTLYLQSPPPIAPRVITEPVQAAGAAEIPQSVSFGKKSDTQSSHMKKGKKALMDFTDHERKTRLQIQIQKNSYDRFVEGNLILHQGHLDKRKGLLIPRRRMFLLTTGPHLYYVDSNKMVKKGEIPWTKALRPEAKNFKTFFIHTPKRVFYLEDSEGHAPDWCDAILEVHTFYYSMLPSPPETSRKSKPSSR